MKTRKICPLATRIKKMMQTDDDVGKISQATPILIGRAMELFLDKLCRQAITIAQSRQAKTLTPSHLKAAVKADNTLDFLAELVAPAPDLPAAEPENGDAAPKPTKRRRTNDTGDAQTPPEGRGRGRSSAAATSGHASDDTPPGPPARGRGSKPPLPPGSQGPQSRGPKKESGGRRGPKGKAAAAAAAVSAASASGTEGMEPVPSHASEPAGSGLNNTTTPVVQATFAEAPAPELAATSSLTALKQQECVVKHEAGPKQEPTAVANSGTASGAGCSIVAALRAQQPFFGLGRKGKNLGNKNSATTASPASAPMQSHPTPRQQQASPQQTMDEAAFTTPAPLSDDGQQPQAHHPYPLKLKPVDMSAPATTLETASSRQGEANGRVVQQSPFGHRLDSSGAAGVARPIAAPEVSVGEDVGMGTGQLSMAGSSAGPAAGTLTGGPIQTPFVSTGAGSIIASLGASMAYFQAPQHQGDMDDDYDDY